MELAVIVLVVSLLALALSVVLFSLAMKHEAAARQVSIVEAPVIPTTAESRFFADTTAGPLAATSTGVVSAETLVRHIERHIRLEQAAAEAFLEQPTPQSLHRPTASPLLR